MSVPAVTRAAMQWLDRRAIEHYGMAELVLMACAGVGCAALAARLLGGVTGRRVHVLCGRGNNGGDGFVIARRLADAGADVRVFVSGGVAAVRPGAAAGVNLQILQRLGLAVADSLPGDLSAAGACDLLIDALFGTGLDRPVAGHDRALIEAVNQAGLRVLAVDLPSGLDADTGAPLGAAIRAAATAALAFPKCGFLTPAGQAHTGTVEVVDIGIPRAALADAVRVGMVAGQT